MDSSRGRTTGNGGRERRERREQRAGDEGDLQYEPKWPQRPGRSQADAPATARPSDAANSAPAPSQPPQTAAGSGPDATKETRLLPVVEPPRRDASPQRSSAPVSPPGSMPVVRFKPGAPPASPPEDRSYSGVQERGRPDTSLGRGQYSRYEESDRYGRYEREIEGFTEYDDLIEQRPETRRPALAPPTPRAQARGRGEAQAGPKGARGYLTAEAETAKRRPSRAWKWLGWALIGVLAVAAIGVLSFSLAWQGQYAGKIYPGVTVLDNDLGGRTPEEARKWLQSQVQAFDAQPVVFAWRGKEWRPNAKQIGLQVDVDATIEEAFGVGRESDLFSNVAQQWVAAQGSSVVPVTVKLDEPVLQSYLETIAGEEINQELFEGDVRLNGTEIVALPGKEGRILRTYEAISKVREQAAKLEQARIDLPVEVVQPTVSAEEVGYIQAQLAIRINGPITATSQGKVFTLSRDALVNFTTIERNPDRTASRHIDLGWKENELKAVGEKWAAEASHPAENARFAWNGGQLAVLKESVDGFETTASAVAEAIKEASRTSDKRQFELPGKVLPPSVSSKDLPALGIKEPMGSGTSTFKGSSRERATNIEVAANLLNGAVVPPGGTFSFLETMGGIDEAHGFVPGYVIAAERTQLGVGGGVCQVSTTMFRSAFWSGVEITERHQHSYRVGWYEANGEPVGFDAAVFDPGVDLKFVNTTQSYILIEAVVGDETLTVKMYGTKLPGEVKLEGPVISNRVPPPADVYEVDPRLPAGTKKQVETARAGLDTVITRRIVVPGQPDKVDEFKSSYKAWPNWFIVASPSQIPGGSR